MKVLVIFAAALLCVQAVRVPYIQSESSEEEYHILLPPNRQKLVNLAGVGVVSQPIIQAVKVKVPRYASPLLKQQIIEQYLAVRGLSIQSFAGQDVDAGSNVAAEDLNARLDNFYNIGMGQQPWNAPHVGANRPFANQMFFEASQKVELSTTSPIDTTTVPDVIETSTMTELPMVEGVTVMMDTTTPEVSSTDTPTTTNTPNTIPTSTPPTASAATITTTTEHERQPQPNPFIPFFGFGALLPASVSRVPFVPRIPIDPPSTDTTTITVEPVAVPQPGTTTERVLSRMIRAVPFGIKNHTQMIKVTPVPPVPQTEIRGPKMRKLPGSRKSRAVDMVAAKPAQAETKTQSNCDIGCTKLDFNPVCAFNGECYHQFANQCVMDTFVCKRPDLGFTARPEERCRMHWLKRCNAEALQGA